MVLQRWFHDNVFHSASPSLSQKINASHSAPRKIITINELQSFQASEKLVWYSLVATITNVNMNDFHFLACPLFVDGIQCMKKISHKVRYIWHCGNCDGEFLECDYRYILKVDLEDNAMLLPQLFLPDFILLKLWDPSASFLCGLIVEGFEPSSISVRFEVNAR